MRVVIITGHHFTPDRDGVSTFMIELVKNLPADQIICLTGDPNAKPINDRNEIILTSLFDPGGKWTKIPQMAGIWWRLKCVFRPDLILTDFCWSGNIALLLKRLLGIPLVVFAHGNELLKLSIKQWNKPRLCLEKADQVIAISRYTRSLLRDIGIPDEKVSVVLQGVDPGLFFPISQEEVAAAKAKYGVKGKKVLLTTGGLLRRKGQDRVIEALPRVLRKHPDLVYLIAGEGKDEPAYRKLADKLGLGEQVRFLGRIPTTGDLRELYNICDIFIMPSRLDLEARSVENFGITFIEAGACGKPVIGGRSGGIPEAIIDGVTGLLVDPESVEEIAGAVLSLLADPVRAKEMGERGRERALNELTWARICGEVGRICLRVLREHAVGRR